MRQPHSPPDGPHGPRDGPDSREGPDRQRSWSGRVVLVLATSTGGVGGHVADLARRLAAGGSAVTVCGPAATNDRFGFDPVGRAGAPVGDGEVGFAPVEISSGRLSDARAVTALRRVLARSRPDVVHAHGLRAGLVAALANRSGSGGPPLVVTLHNAVLARGVRGGAARAVERLVARAADVVLCASADLVTRAREHGAAKARLGPVAAPPLPQPGRGRAAVRAELGVPEDRSLILSVGRLHPQKGYDVLVDAAARWRRRDPPPLVVIAGDGPSYLELVARISAARAPVTLLGHRHDVADLLAAADLAVVSSVWEARQLFAQEAMRAGVPLVTTAVGGMPELVGDGAVLVPAGDVDALHDAVTRLLDHPQERRGYAERGRRQAATWPTPEQALAEVLAAYRDVSSVEPEEPGRTGGRR